jgi:hypothetical protein
MAVPHHACTPTGNVADDGSDRTLGVPSFERVFTNVCVPPDGELPGSALLHERPKHLHYGDNGHHRGWILNGELTPMHIAQGTRLPPGLAGIVLR